MSPEKPGMQMPESDSLAFLAGGGEMGRLIAAMDWSKTPLGPIASWPQSLRTAVSLCLEALRPTEQTIRQNQAWLAGQKQALQAALSGAPLAESLAVLVNSSMAHYGPTTRAAFYLADRVGKTLYHVVGMGPEYAKKCEGFPIGPDSFACGLAIHDGKPILTTDVRQEPKWEQWLWITENFDFRACGSFPLQTSDGKVLGTFAVYWREPHEATPADGAFANTVADTASIIVARHVEAEERKRAEAALAAELDAMTRLQGLSDRLLTTADWVAALGEVLDTAIALHAADRGTAQVYDPTLDCLRYAAARGFDAAALDAVPPIQRDFHSTCAAAIRTGAPVLAADIPADPRFADHAATAAALGYRAAFSFPLTTRRGGFLGVLTVHFREPREPAERELRWAALYARLAAHLIERAQMDETMRRANEGLERRTAELASANDLLRAGMEARDHMRRQLATAQENERRRVARDLHDSVGQLLTGLSLAAQAAATGPLSEPTNARLAEVQRVADALAKEVHGLAVRLRPTALDDLGLEPALRQLADEWSARSGVPVDFQTTGLGNRLPAEAETVLYRVVQEALTNVGKHAQAKSASVVVSRYDGEATAVVEDNGVGFDPDAVARGRLGLLGMRERVTLLGGQLDVESSPQGGTTIIARVPVTDGQGRAGHG
jgi:signal transduction histidine kinase